MIPEPGCQKPMPYLFEAEARKSYTSLLVLSATARSLIAPTLARIRWSQCTVVGTAVPSRPAVMNCKIAICAVASCIATRSGFSSAVVSPRRGGSRKPLSRCANSIFSASVSGRRARLRAAAMRAGRD